MVIRSSSTQWTLAEHLLCTSYSAEPVGPSSHPEDRSWPGAQTKGELAFNWVVCPRWPSLSGLFHSCYFLAIHYLPFRPPTPKKCPHGQNQCNLLTDIPYSCPPSLPLTIYPQEKWSCILVHTERVVIDNWWTTSPRNTAQEPKKKKKKQPTGRVEGFADGLVQGSFLSSFSLY